ncbi:protein DENND6A [Salix suchowensis]|nr:protein DENND6A [Salix suchowensis]
MSRSPSFVVKQELTLKTDLESLQQWVVAFCIIRFDLEQGQLIEECYPPGSLSNEEELDVAFSSFPDSVSQNQNRTSIHDCIFFFRIQRRKSSEQRNVNLLDIIETDDKEVSSNSTKEKVINRRKNRIDTKRLKYLYGYVFNRQRHDERLRRGGEQKSVVILSHNPYSRKKTLEHIAAYVSTWPAPAPGKHMELPIGNALLKVSLPPAHSLPFEIGMFEESSSAMAPFLPNNHILLQLWLLWELLLIGEPILIIGSTPPQCCEAVASLVSLVAPLPCSIDFRPYFTIHDPDFKHLNSLREGNTFPPMILAVTNLFFLKALRNIPHIVSVGSPAPNSNQVPFASRSAGRIPGRPEGFGLQKLSLKKFSPSSLLSAVKLRRDGPLCLMTEHKEAPDTSILNRLIDAGMLPRVEESMSVVNNEILATTPSEGSIPFIDPHPLPPFDADEFLANLSARGVGKFLSKRMKSNWLDLYKRFLKGPNFMPWFQRRLTIAEQEQNRLWRQARMTANINLLISKMPEWKLLIISMLLKDISMVKFSCRNSMCLHSSTHGTYKHAAAELSMAF